MLFAKRGNQFAHFLCLHLRKMKTLREELQVIEDRSLDYHELSTILAHRVAGLTVKYTDLAPLKDRYTMNDILPGHVNAGLVLLTARLNSKVQRHWVVFLRHADNRISYFDSLALGPHTLSSYMKDKGYFAAFIKKNRCDVNKKRHQKSTDAIRTCGLHCCCRMVKHQLRNSQYDHWMFSVRMPPDEIVALLTFIGHLSI